MPLIPNFIERLMLLKLNLAPGLMLDFLGALAFQALCAGAKLGVFEILGGDHLTGGEVARRIEADERGTVLLLEALETLGYLEKKDGHYANTPITTKWLVGSSPTNLVPGIPFFENMAFDRWAHLDVSIRTGRPAITTSEWLSQHPDGYRIYQQGMIAVARIAAEEVVRKVKLRGARSLLDVGGGHGLYSIEFCLRYPNLSATVIDLPEALEVAREMIAAEQMVDRVTLREGDFFTDDVGAGHDVVLLFNLLHAYLPERNIELLRKISGALKPAGVIVIMEQITGQGFGPTATALARLLALDYFNDLGGQTYSFNQIARWLTEAGFKNARRIALHRMPGFGLVLGEKTGRRGH